MRKMVKGRRASKKRKTNRVTTVAKRTRKKRRKKRLPVEPKIFKKGDRVQAREKRTCFNGVNYVMKGRVTKVLGPYQPDEEYEYKWLHSAPTHRRYLYHVEYRCPVCRKMKAARYYGPELKRLK